MESITSVSELKDAIRALENKQVVQGQLLKEQFNITVEKFKPSNLFKTIKHDVSTPSVLKNFVYGFASLAAGYYSKKLIVGRSGSKVLKYLGRFMQLGITGLIAKNQPILRSFSEKFMQHFLKRKTV